MANRPVVECSPSCHATTEFTGQSGPFAHAFCNECDSLLPDKPRIINSAHGTQTKIKHEVKSALLTNSIATRKRRVILAMPNRTSRPTWRAPYPLPDGEQFDATRRTTSIANYLNAIGPSNVSKCSICRRKRTTALSSWVQQRIFLLRCTNFLVVHGRECILAFMVQRNISLCQIQPLH